MKQNIENISSLMAKSRDKIKTAKLNFKAGQYDDSVSRAYYAVFHAISALLLSNGQAYSSHSQTIGAFNKDFVKTGVFPKNVTAMIQSLFDGRQTGDYDPVSDISREDAENAIKDAIFISSLVSSHLGIGDSP